jgi:hypothetical protein
MINQGKEESANIEIDRVCNSRAYNRVQNLEVGNLEILKLNRVFTI